MLLAVLKVTVSASITSVSKSLLPSLILNTNKIIKTTNKPDVAVLATNAAIVLWNSRRRLFFQFALKAGIVGTCWSCFWRTRTVLFTSACLDVHNKKHSSSDASPVDCRSNSSSYQMCQGLSLILSKRNVWETFTEDMASRRSVLLAKNNNGIFLLRISRTRKLHKRRESVWVNCQQIIETIKAKGLFPSFFSSLSSHNMLLWSGKVTQRRLKRAGVTH